MFEERLKEQNERYDGGNRWIGTGGTSLFGHGGQPAGIRVGGSGGGRSAVQIAAKRRFKDYHDLVLDTRQRAWRCDATAPRTSRSPLGDRHRLDDRVNRQECRTWI